MAKTKRQFIAASALTSLVGFLLGVVALTTKQWVTSDAIIMIDTHDEPSLVYYGLFSGVYRQVLATNNQNDYSLAITCLLSSNVCAMMCGTGTGETRKEDLEILYNGLNITSVCGATVSSASKSISSSSRAANSSRKFINAGAYAATIAFLLLSIFYGVIGTALSLWNFVDNPVQIWFNIFGLYIYNGIACGAGLMALILWGALFGATLSKDVCFYYSIMGLISTESLAALGFSYWLMLPMVFSYGCSIAVLKLRQYFIDQEPQIMIHPSDREDIANTIVF